MKLFVILMFLLGCACALLRARALADTFNLPGGGKERFFTQPQPDKSEEVPTSEFQQFRPAMYRLNPKVMDYDEAMDLLNRITRAAGSNKKNESPVQPQKPCKYKKGAWSACDADSHVRIRTDTLRKGNANLCESVKTRKKDCKTKKGKQRNKAAKAGRPNKQKKE